MKVQIIDKNGVVFQFSSVAAAKPHIKKKYFKEYRIEKQDGKNVRVYDDRELKQ